VYQGIGVYFLDWKQVIRDTINGIPIDRTARGLRMHHQTVFNMRHKVLFCLETEQCAERVLSRVLESDETYILESLKREGKAYSRAAGRGKVRREEILRAFKGKISGNALMVCDGTASYKVLEK
jgi:hypothetical protein